jgi:hypothetical protein
VYNGFVKLRRGLVEHFEHDKLTYLEAGIYIRLILKADYNTGVLYLRTDDLVSEEAQYDQIYRALVRLEKKKYIRAFRRTGSKSRYAILINKHCRPEDGKLLNAFKSKSPDRLEWECCGAEPEVDPRTPRGGAEDSTSFSAQPQENTEVTLSKEVRSKELKKERSEEDMSAKKQIPVICHQVLGMKAERWDNIWAEIKELTDAFGQAEVTEAFRNWANSQDPDSVKKPLAEFLDVAPGILRGVRTLHTSQDCQALITELGDMSDGVVLFNDKLSTEIARLRKSYPDADIKAAYHEFLSNRGDFNLNYAAKDFTETAAQLIEIRRKRQEKIEQTEKQIQEIVAKGQSESEKILANIPKPVDFSNL